MTDAPNAEEALSSLLLLVRDYSASSRTDHLHWYFSNIINNKSVEQAADENVLLLHGESVSGAVAGLSCVSSASELKSVGSGALFKDVMVQRSSKSFLADGNELDPASTPVALSDHLSFVGVGTLGSSGKFASSLGIEPDQAAGNQDNEKSAKLNLPPFTTRDWPAGTIIPKTHLTILSCKYRIVFSLDTSPSMATVDPLSGEVLFDQLYSCIERLLIGLVQPIRVGNVELTPQIHASFVLQGNTPTAFRLILHGIVITAQTLHSALLMLKSEFSKGESTLVQKMSSSISSSKGMNVNSSSSVSNSTNPASSMSSASNNQATSQNAPSSTLPGGTSQSSVTGASAQQPSQVLANADMGSPLKNAMFVLKMLPLDACPLLIVLTDGVTNLPEECEMYDSLLMLMSREDIACSAVQIGSAHFPDFTSFGFLPDTDLLRHFVTCTGGTYMDAEFLQDALSNASHCPVLEINANSPPQSIFASKHLRCNQVQASLLFRQPLGDASWLKMHTKSTEFGDLGSDSIDHPFPWSGTAPRQPLIRIPYKQYQIVGVNLQTLLNCRFRESFVVSKIQITRSSTFPKEFTIKLAIPWKESIYITYTIKTTLYNDIPNCTPEIQVHLDVHALYDVQLQWTQLQRPNTPSNPSMIVPRLQQFLSSIVDTDKQLYALTGQTITLNEILGRSLQSPLHVQIEKMFWKTLSQLPKNVWHRWYKMDRMEIILSPDLLLNAHSGVHQTGHRIELRRKNPDDILSSATSGSQPATGTGIGFRFDSGTKELLAYLDNWTCFSSSKHSFAKVLEHTVVTGSNTSQIIASIASKPDADSSSASKSSAALLSFSKAANEARTLTVPSYCVLRLTWESRNIAMLSFYFFGVSSSDRFRLMASIQHDLLRRTNPNDPSVSLFSICNKPLRYSLVRYQLGQLREKMTIPEVGASASLLSNTLQSLLTPVFNKQQQTTFGLTGPSSTTPAASTSSSMSSLPAFNPSGGYSTSSTANTATVTDNHHGHAIQSDAGILYATEDANLRALISFTPLYQLLVEYMYHKRWIWSINSDITQEAAVEAIVRCRLSEGFSLLANVDSPALASTPSSNSVSQGLSATSASGMAQSGAAPSNSTSSSASASSAKHLLHSFFKEIVVSTKSQAMLGTSSNSTDSQTAVVQYLVYSTPQGYLVTELWMDPVFGYIIDQGEETNDVFGTLKKLIYEIDLHTISTIATFDTLALLHNPHITRDILSVPTEVSEYNLDSTDGLCDVSVQRPPFNLRGLASVAVQHQETFNCFEKEDNTPLHQCLFASLSYICDRQLPNKGTFAMGPDLRKDCPVWTKAIPNSTELLLVALHPLTASASGLTSSTPAFSGPSTPVPHHSPAQPSHSPAQPLLRSSTRISASSTPTLSPYVTTSSFGALPDSHMASNAATSQTKEALNLPSLQNLAITVYQCSRVVEPPADLTWRVQRILGLRPSEDELANATTVEPSTSAYVLQICETLQTEHHRSFVKSLFLNLRGSTSRTPDLSQKDYSYALQICQEYVLEMDLTQFFRIISRWHSHSTDEEGGRRRTSSIPNSFNSYGSSDSASPLDASQGHTMDTSLLFDKILACQFKKVPQADNYFYFSPSHFSSSTLNDSDSDYDPDLSGPNDNLDDEVAIHVTQPPNHGAGSAGETDESQGEEQDDLEDWIDDLSKRYRAAAVITSASNVPTAATTSSSTNAPTSHANASHANAALQQQQHNTNVLNNATSVWSTFPLFMRMECAVVPKPGSSSNLLSTTLTSTNASADASASGHYWDGNFGDQGQRNSPGGLLRVPGKSPLDAPSTPGHDAAPLNINSFPISTLPNPKQISVLQQLSSSGNRAFVKFYAIVLPKHGESNEGASPVENLNNSPGSMDNSPSPLNTANPHLSAKDSSFSRHASLYTRLPRTFRKVLESLSSSVRSVVAQKSLDLLRSRVPVTRVISDIVSHNMRQLNPNAFTVMRVPLVFVEPQLGITLFFNEFAKSSLIPLRVIDRTLFFAVQPSPTAFPSTQHLSLSSSSFGEGPGSLGGAAGPLHQSSGTPTDAYTIPYWLFMTAHPTHVQIRFQSPPSALKRHEKEAILESARDSINHVARRVNQLILLNQLFDARVSSVLLTVDPTSAVADGHADASSVDSSHSKPISIPRKGSDGASKPVSRHADPIDEEGIFEHDSEEQQRNTESSFIPRAPQLPQHYHHQESSPNRSSIIQRTTSAFKPGQFACDQVHEIVLPLNWRTEPKTILNAIAGTVMVHFSVSNRSKMYVYREQSGKIFYMTLSVSTNSSDDDSTAPSEDGSHKTESTKQPPHSAAQAIIKNAEPSALELVTSSVSSQTGLSTSTSNPSLRSGSMYKTSQGSTVPSSSEASNASSAFLVLKIFGVDAPSEEITVQLRTLLETKLSYFTLQVISAMLLRNPLMKLKTADDAFLRSPDTPPRRFHIELPSFVTDLHLFKNFIKTNILKQGLSQLNLDSDKPTMPGTPHNGLVDPTGHSNASNLRSGGGVGRTPESDSLLSTPVIPSTLASWAVPQDTGSVFLYNNMTSVPTSQPKSSVNFGNGLATVSVVVQPPAISTPSSTLPRTNATPLGSQSSCETGASLFYSSPSIEDSPMHDLFLSMLSSSEVEESKPSTGRRSSTPAFMQTSPIVEIKIWTKGTIEVAKLVEHLEKISNQTIAEYQFEWYAYLAEARDHGFMDVNQFICDAQRLLEHATKLESPSIKTLHVPVSVPSWAMSSYLLEMQKRLVDVNQDFQPTLYYNERTSPVKKGKMRYDRPSLAAQESFVMTREFTTAQPPDGQDLPVSTTPLSFGDSLRLSSSQGLAVGPLMNGWLPFDVDPDEKRGSSNLIDAATTFSKTSRRYAVLCTKSSLIRGWKPKQTSFKIGRDQLATTSVLSGPTTPDPSSTPSRQSSSDAPTSRTFASLFVDAFGVQVYAYNWSTPQIESLASLLLKETNFLHLRHHLLGNVLHQKMGLFHHNAPMQELSTTPAYSTTSAYRSNSALNNLSRFMPPPTLLCPPANTPSTVAPVSTAAMVATTPGGSTTTLPVSNQNISSSIAIQSTPLIVKFSFDNLEYLAQTTSPTSSASGPPSRRGSEDASKDSNKESSAYKRWRISASNKLNDLKIDEILRRVAPLATISFKLDPVMRHASQFKSIAQKYMRYHQSMQTLLGVYNLWQKKDRNSVGQVKSVARTSQKPAAAAAPQRSGSAPLGNAPQASSNPPSGKLKQLDDKNAIDSNQLATLVRYARLLHSVKIPFFLSDMFVNEDLFEGPPMTSGARADSKLDGSQSSIARHDFSSNASDASANFGKIDEIKITQTGASNPSAAQSLNAPLSPSASLGSIPPGATSPSQTPLPCETTQRVMNRPEMNLRFDPATHSREKQQKYRQALLTRFFDEFTEYLATFGVNPVVIKPNQAPQVSVSANSSPSQVHLAAASAPTTPAKHSPAQSPDGKSSDSPLAGSSTGLAQAVDIAPPKQQRYLQKVFRGGLILFELEGGGPGNFSVSCNLFTLFFHRLTAYFGAGEDVVSSTTPNSLKHLAFFTRECTNIKTQLHMNSFVYDFHVRHMYQLLSATGASQASNAPSFGPAEKDSSEIADSSSGSAKLAAPSVQPASATGPSSAQSSTKLTAPSVAMLGTPSVELINLLQAMVLHYEQPPKHARAALSSSHISIDVTDAILSPLELFAYATKNAKKFDWNSTFEIGLSPGIVKSSAVPSFALQANPPSPGATAEDAYVMVAFMSHPSDASAATNHAISSSLAGGSSLRSLESAYNACYRVARQKHLAVSSFTPSQPLQAHMENATGLGMGPMLGTNNAAPVDSSSSHMSPIGAFTLLPTASSSSATASHGLKASPSSESLGSMGSSISLSATGPSLSSALTPTPSAQSAATPLRNAPRMVMLNNAATPKAPRSLTISFFVLRVAKHTTFPLMASAFATPPPTSLDMDEGLIGTGDSESMVTSDKNPPAATSLATYNRRNMTEALHAGRTLLNSVAHAAITQSERDVLWAKLVSDPLPSSPDFLPAEQCAHLLRLAHSRPIDTLDATLASMTNGISTDWKAIMDALSRSYPTLHRNRVFLSDGQQPHLLLFNHSDPDLLLHIFVTDPRKLDVHCVRREFIPPFDKKHSSLEAVQVAHLVNSICHLLWKQLVPKTLKR